MFERYPEKTFYRIQKIETLDAPLVESMDENRKMKVWVQKVFRGRLYKNPVEIERASYKTDYRLLSKHEEKDYCQIIEDFSNDKVLIANKMELPPLLKEMISREKGEKNPQMQVKIKCGHNKLHRLARDGEKPTLEIPINIGKPASLSLYEGIKL